MTTNELLIEFINFSNKLETERNQIPISRANIFLANHKPKFKNLDLHIVSGSASSDFVNYRNSKYCTYKKECYQTIACQAGQKKLCKYFNLNN